MSLRSETMPAFESLDRLAITEMRPPTSPAGIMGPLYTLIRSEGASPLSHQAASALLGRQNSKVLIVTGLVDAERFPCGEIDGPIGSTALARSLSLLGMSVTIIVDEEAMPAVRAVMAAADVADVEVVTPTFASAEEARAFGAGFEAVIAVEKLGRNSLGERHLIWGTPVDVGDAYADEYVLGAQAAGALTIAVGDNGNEIGFGVIADIAESLAPSGVHCDGGFFAATPADVLMLASVSNFGCYAICAALAILAGRPELALDGDVVLRWTQAGLDAGLRSGGVEDPRFQGDDGIPLRFVKAYADMLAGVVHQSLLGEPWLAAAKTSP